METNNPVIGWEPLAKPQQDLASPVVEWRDLPHKRNQAIIESYGPMGESEINESQKRFATAVAGYVSKRFHYSDSINILDASANDLNVTLEFCSSIFFEMTQKGQNPNKIKVWANDLSYSDGQNNITELGNRAEKKLESSGEVTKLVQKPLINKRSQQVEIQDLGGQAADVIWDRLGAMWHTLTHGDVSSVQGLLDKYRNLLKTGGVLIFDGYAPDIGKGFNTDGRLKIFLEHNGLNDEWFVKQGFKVNREEVDKQRLLILEKT